MTRPFAVIAMMSVAFWVPLQATALSCAPLPDPVLILNETRLAPDEVIVGYGAFSAATERRSPVASSLDAGTSEFEFQGVMFAEGAVIPTDPVTSVISTECTHEIWCNGLGHPIIGVPYVVVFDRAPSTGQLSIFSGLCGSSIMLSVANLRVEDLASCLASGSCTQADFGY
ncbi:hypothetical protein [Litoreibacter roseus]|uniref:Uncharacterized protein n=1 Tax=Litoreibacter roseus TaxID=2601869 RepID=A0A6N6JIQ2_9RHOB|nr:hypothetical protein [Litoreibacter roseus]GFE65168.1 hypothetical protein KIN_22420 [Litoreibacter roseus]